jgi:hypothetical protein
MITLFFAAMALLNICCVIAWLATTCVIAVDLAKRFRSRTLYVALIALFLMLGLTWGENSPRWCVLGLALSCFVLPPVRLLLHWFCKPGFELRGQHYKLFVQIATIPFGLGCPFMLFLGCLALAH